MKKIFVVWVVSCLLGVRPHASGISEDKGWELIEGSAQVSNQDIYTKINYSFVLNSEKGSPHLSKINFEVIHHPNNSDEFFPDLVISTIIKCYWKDHRAWKSAKECFKKLGKYYLNNNDDSWFYSAGKGRTLYGWKFPDKSNILLAHHTHNQVLNNLTDHEFISLEMISAIREQFKKCGVEIYTSYREFKANIEQSLPENPSSDDLKEIFQAELNKVPHDNHRQLLIWKTYKTEKDNVYGMDTEFLVWLLDQITIKDLSFYDKSQIRKLEYLASLKSQSTKDATYLEIRSCLLRIKHSPKTQETLKDDIKNLVKLRFISCPEKEKYLENVPPIDEPTEENYLKLFYQYEELVEENIKLKDKLKLQTPVPREQSRKESPRA